MSVESPGPGAALSAFLRRRREEIVDRWTRVIQEASYGRKLSRAVLRDHVPRMLDRIADEAEARSRAEAQLGADQEAHSDERLELGLDLEAIVWEYLALRHILARMVAEDGVVLDPAEWDLLGQALDHGVAVASRRHAELRRHQIDGLDRLTRQALQGVPDLDAAFSGIGPILVDTTAADSVVVLMSDDEHLYVRAASELDRPIESAPIIALDGWAAQITAGDEPRVMRPAEPDGWVPWPRDTRIVYGAPLRTSGELLGLVLFATSRAPDFNEEELLVFRSAAARVHTIVCYARLAIRERARAAAADAFAAATTLDDGLTRFVVGLCECFGWEVADYWALGDDGRLRHRFHHTTTAEQFEDLRAVNADTTFGPGDGLPGRVLEDESVRWWTDHRHEVELQRRHVVAAEGIKSAMAFPVACGKRFLGVIELMSRRVRAPVEQGVELTRALTAHLDAFLRRLDEDERARRSEAQKAAILDVAIDAIVSMDASGHIVSWSRSAEQMFGFSAEDAVGRELAETIIPPRYREAHRRGLAHYLATREGRLMDRHAELAAIRRDGSEFPAEVTITRARIADPPWFVGYVRDITERKRAEAEQARREQEQRFLSEASRVLATSLDLSETLERLTRLAVPDLADWCVVDVVRESGQIQRGAIGHVDPEKVRIAWELYGSFSPDGEKRATPGAIAQTTGESVVIEEITDTWLRRVGVEEDILPQIHALGLSSLMVVPMRVRGATVGLLTLASSTPDRRFDESTRALAHELAARAAQAVDNARLFEQARQATRLRDDMLAVVTHDLKNPLASIRLASGLMSRYGPGDPAMQRPLASIGQAVGIMDRLIRDLLDVARIQSGRLPVETRPEPVAEVIQEAVTLHGALASEKGLRLEARVDMAPDLLVALDRARIHQVLSNLVGNAIKFCRPGDRVVVGARAERRGVHFVVEDTGPGIAPDDRAHLFEAYWSAEPHRTAGAGLGLYIAKGIVEAHGGRIWVDSEPGAGTTFHFTLPYGHTRNDVPDPA